MSLHRALLLVRALAATAAVVAVLAATVVAAPPASAGHRPPEAAYHYMVRTRGDVSDPQLFAAHAARTLADVRGWTLGGSVSLHRVDDRASADFTLWLAEADEMEGFSTACSPRWSCTVGDDVVINDDNWRHGTQSWDGSLDEYRHMVVNHELGHWLDDRLAPGFRLDHVSCPAPGEPAPVMMQQSIDLEGCRENAWPLPSERRTLAGGLGVEVRFGEGRSAAAMPGGQGLHGLDAFGGLHPLPLEADGAAPPAASGEPELPFAIARDVALLPDGSGGYVLDGWGGLHPFAVGEGPAPPAVSGAGYWRGWDIARGVALLPDGSGGFVVDGWGGPHGFAVGGGRAPDAAAVTGHWEGDDVARAVVVGAEGGRGAIVGAAAASHPFDVR